MPKPKLGGYTWRHKLSILRQLDYEDKKTIEELLEVAKTVETVKMLAGLLSNKLERIALITELLEGDFVEPEEPES